MQWADETNHPVTKVCAKCGVEKPFPEFYLCFKRGRCRASCRECDRARMRRHVRANRERVRAWERRGPRPPGRAMRRLPSAEFCSRITFR